MVKALLNNGQIGILFVSLADLTLGLYFAFQAISWQSNKGTLKEIICYDFLALACGLIILLPFIYLSICVAKKRVIGLRANIILFTGMMVVGLIKFFQKFTLVNIVIELLFLLLLILLIQLKYRKIFI
jgi:hypothetical protein